MRAKMIHVTDHAFFRWKERVNAEIARTQDIVKLVKKSKLIKKDEPLPYQTPRIDGSAYSFYLGTLFVFESIAIDEYRLVTVISEKLKPLSGLFRIPNQPRKRKEKKKKKKTVPSTRHVNNRELGKILDGFDLEEVHQDIKMSDKLIKKHTFNFNKEKNGGETVSLTTKFYNNKDEIYYNQELTMESYSNSASFNLCGATITPVLLRQLADELETIEKEAKLEVVSPTLVV